MKTSVPLLLVLFSHLSFSQTVTDIDGNTYSTVIIGAQEWTAENLNTVKYNDGTSIALVTDNTAWGNLTTGAYCYLENDKATYETTNGALYNWYTGSTGKLCPTGWRVPSATDWTTLSDYVGANGHLGVEGKALKSTSAWVSGDGTDDFGFKGLPAGIRNTGAGFFPNGYYGYWWATDESSIHSGSGHDAQLLYNYDNFWNNRLDKIRGMSVRCLKDIATSIENSNNTSNALLVYPNPTKSLLNLSGFKEHTKFFIYNLYGSQVQSAKVTSTIDVGRLANGVYSIRFVDNTGTIIKTEKVVIAH